MIDLALFTLIFVLLLTVVVLMFYRKHRQLRDAIVENGRQLQQHQQELAALFAGAAGVGSHLVRLESQIHGLTDRQEKQDAHDPVAQNYHLAIDLVHQGASARQLVEQCGILHEEAELLLRLHGPRLPD